MRLIGASIDVQGYVKGFSKGQAEKALLPPPHNFLHSKINV